LYIPDCRYLNIEQSYIDAGCGNNKNEITNYEIQTFRKNGEDLVKVGYQLWFFMASVVVALTSMVDFLFN